ncbi:NAD(P)H-dependent flavin oxidoreductase [Serpens gallinarum]|uniref:Nitronate monooxygenase n=1 Tax=Serpens gallinarum TaxID=2763075 RepID=A0ABR8TP29_9PSED|nr:nitronate monooxygenase [Serpens gallinarum]MBD7977517.1 nitronate monooxygenase [Serpens gallinarum]
MSHPALHTALIDLLGCDVPVLCAGMGGVARHQLAAAVSNAGGFGCLGMVREPVARIRAEVAAYRQLSERPFAVNLIPAATPAELLRAQVHACLELKVPAVVLFWDVDSALIRLLKAEGVLVMQQIAARAHAEQALEAGVDALIAQGSEAGGHVWGTTGSLALLAEIVSFSSVPVVACGGIASGEALVAALALGAQGVCCGSAFLATHEANAHDYHKQQLVKAGAGDTVLSERFFRNWPMTAPVRVLPNAVTRGEYDVLYAKRETPVIGEQDGRPVHLFSTDSPLKGAQGKLADMPIYAGQSCGQIHQICSAAERLEQLVHQAECVLGRFDQF